MTVWGQAAGAAQEVKYPVKVGPLDIYRSSEPNLEKCQIGIFRAIGPAGTDEGPLHIFAEKLWNAKGEGFVRGQVMLDVKSSAFTNREPRTIDVRIDLDGKTHDMPSADVQRAVLTFLNFRFPIDFLNEIGSAKSLRIYTLDPATKAPTLFASSDLSALQAAIPDFSRCANALPDLPSQLPDGFMLAGNAEGCAVAPRQEPDYGVVLAPARGNRKESVVLFFLEGKPVEMPMMKKPRVAIGDAVFPASYERVDLGDGVEHRFYLSPAALDKFAPGALLAIDDDKGQRVLSLQNMLLPFGATMLRKCAAANKAQPAAK